MKRTAESKKTSLAKATEDEKSRFLPKAKSQKLKAINTE